MRKFHRMVSLSFSLFAALFATACAMGPGGDEALGEGGLEQGKGSNACSQGVAGDGKSCQDLGALKLAAYEACEEAGLSLVDIEYIHGACGLDAKLAQYKCCPPPPPAPDPDPTPEPEPVACTEGALGDGVVCQDLSVFKLAASDACTQAGLVLTDIAYGQEGCPSGQSYKAAYVCCEAAPKSP